MSGGETEFVLLLHYHTCSVLCIFASCVKAPCAHTSCLFFFFFFHFYWIVQLQIWSFSKKLNLDWACLPLHKKKTFLFQSCYYFNPNRLGGPLHFTAFSLQCTEAACAYHISTPGLIFLKYVATLKSHSPSQMPAVSFCLSYYIM